MNKNNQMIIKVISIVCIIALIANILLFSFRIYSAMTMWIVIIVIAIFAFPGMKILKRKLRYKKTETK